jgi:putative transposase
MTDLFLDRYRIKSIRKNGHDYSSPGKYFITINTDAKINWFGSIQNGKMQLSPTGEIVRKEWLKSEIVRHNIQLDEWIIMPNHIHGIIIINKTHVETARWAVSSSISINTVSSSNTINDAITSKTVALNTDNNYYNRTSILKPNSLGSIIGQFKSICTKRIRKNGYKYFKWQDRYYDHIIRNDNEFQILKSYIKLNPMRP